MFYIVYQFLFYEKLITTEETLNASVTSVKTETMKSNIFVYPN